MAKQFGLSSAKPYTEIYVDGGTLEASERIYGKGIFIRSGAELKSSLGYVTTFAAATGIVVEACAKIGMTGGATADKSIKQNSNVPVKGSGTIDITGYVTMSTSQLKDFTGAIAGSGTLFATNAVAGENEFVRRFSGTVRYPYPLAFSGQVVLGDGVNIISSPSALAASPAFFGNGPFTLENAVLNYDDANFTSSSSLSLASGSALTYGGIAMVEVAPAASSSAKTIAAGTLVRKDKGSVLQIVDRAYGLFDDGASRVAFDGGLATNAAGLVAHPILIHQNYGWPRYIAFATYDETRGLRAMTNWVDNLTTSDTANRIVRIGEGASGYTVPLAGGACAALFLRNKSLNIRENSTLTVGDGVNPALVVFGMGMADGIGTRNFGTSEGIVYITESGKNIPWKIAGSQGVAFATRSDTSAFDTAVSGANEYSGGTWISGGGFTPMTASAFGSGSITISGSGYVGGAVNFTSGLTLDNAFVLDGVGRIGMKTDVIATLAGVVSGDSLHVSGAAGTLVLAAHNTYAGGTVVDGGVRLRLTNGGSAGTGAVSLKNGVLTFCGRDRNSPIVFANRVEGVGRIVVEGRSPVVLADDSMAYVGAGTVYPGTSVSFPKLEESDVVISVPPPVPGLMMLVK